MQAHGELAGRKKALGGGQLGEDARRLDLGPSVNIDNLEDFISLWEETTQNTFRENWMHSLMKRR